MPDEVAPRYQKGLVDKMDITDITNLIQGIQMNVYPQDIKGV